MPNPLLCRLISLLFLTAGIALFSGCSLLPQTPPAQTIDTSELTDQLQQQDQQLETMNGELLAIHNQLNLIQQNLTQLQQPTKTFKPRPQPPVVQQQNEITAEKEKASVDGKVVLGQIEWLWLQPLGRNIMVRVDTGIILSSIHASNLNIYEKDGQEWVKFVIALGQTDNTTNGNTTENLALDLPIKRYSRVRLPDQDDRDRRPVVEIPVKLGSIQQQTEFTLSTQSSMLYPLSIGRNFLRDMALVDVSIKLSQEPYQPPATSPNIQQPDHQTTEP